MRERDRERERIKGWLVKKRKRKSLRQSGKKEKEKDMRQQAG